MIYHNILVIYYKGLHNELHSIKIFLSKRNKCNGFLKVEWSREMGERKVIHEVKSVTKDNETKHTLV